MSKNRTDRKRQKYLAHLTTIADAFLKARSVYPPDFQGFLEVAGRKEVDVFFQTMHLIDKGATEYGYKFGWYYDRRTNEWAYVFTDLRE